jgi:hypothetical protein
MQAPRYQGVSQAALLVYVQNNASAGKPKTDMRV